MPPAWREHPKLRARFHPEFPDDLQVVAHDKGPDDWGRQAELLWVRVTGCNGEAFSGVVLNQPHQLTDVSLGSEIFFIVPKGGDQPIQITSQYLQERSTWRLIMPCNKCGMTELFDPPSQLVAATFPSVTAEQLSAGFTFTTRCPLCGGGMLVRLKRSQWPWSESK